MACVITALVTMACAITPPQQSEALPYAYEFGFTTLQYAALRSTPCHSVPLNVAPRRRGILVDRAKLAARRSNSNIISQNKRQPCQTLCAAHLPTSRPSAGTACCATAARGCTVLRLLGSGTRATPCLPRTGQIPRRRRSCCLPEMPQAQGRCRCPVRNAAWHVVQ
eukprot:366368-Chlamydomonas_euryale.AAC.1